MAAGKETIFEPGRTTEMRSSGSARTLKTEMASVQRTAFHFFLSSGRGLLQNKCYTTWKFVLTRSASSAEVSSALRPFYFAVHPDLFGQHPNERAVNEASLQQLSSYIETVQQKRTPSPTKLRFFLRPQGEQNHHKGFREVRVNLETRDMRQLILSVLQTCSLPTTAAEKIPPSPPPPPPKPAAEKYKPFEGGADFGFELREVARQERASHTLLSWIKNHYEEAKVRLDAAQPARDEAQRRSLELARLLQLADVRWECGWNQAHYMGCLQSVEALVRDHAEVMGALRGRTLVFGSETGVSLDGQIMFNSGEVRHNWLDLVKKITKHDATLRRIPSLEKAVSGVLREIRVVRRKFQPKVLVSEYESQLRRLTTSLNDYRGKRYFPASWPDKLDQYRLVVETAAGPLMLSPTGQFIVPSSCPAFLLVSFLTEHLEKASKLLQQYKMNKQQEEQLCAQTVQRLGLKALRKDDAVTPERMASCCERLLAAAAQLYPSLDGSELRVTHYFSVLSDGEICVPWDWTL